MTDPGLPEPDDVLRGCLGLRAESIRWTRSASEGETPRMRAVSRRLGNSVLIVTRRLMLSDYFSIRPFSPPSSQPPDADRSGSNCEPGKMYSRNRG